jgi:hypothetical protein
MHDKRRFFEFTFFYLNVGHYSLTHSLENIYGATPATTRGKPVHLGGDPKGKNFVYTCGSAIFIRELKVH